MTETEPEVTEVLDRPTLEFSAEFKIKLLCTITPDNTASFDSELSGEMATQFARLMQIHPESADAAYKILQAVVDDIMEGLLQAQTELPEVPNE
jgi:hypothetical protein